ncbi:MAG: alpha/beta fold hydrolase [Longimicrobiales bacterium]
MLLVPGTFSNHTFWLGTRGTGFARTLAAHGYRAWALDPRGHGGSERQPRGARWDFDDWARRDLPAAIRAIGAPCFLIGHSAGGAAVLAALAARPDLHARARGVVTIGTPLPWLQPWRGLGARMILWAALAFERFPARLLRLGPEDELAGVMSQWMRWNLEGHWRGDDGTDYSGRFGALRMPYLAIAGTGDRFFAPPAACRGLFELIGAPDRELIVFGREDGHTADYGHVDLVVSRPARIEIWPQILRWLDQHRAASVPPPTA